jgi:hypothetical protein
MAPSSASGAIRLHLAHHRESDVDHHARLALACDHARRRSTWSTHSPLSHTSAPVPLTLYSSFCTLVPSWIAAPWHSLPCPHCGAHLLEAELLTWCCKGGTKVLPCLPPLPPCIQNLIGTSPAVASDHSGKLNYLFNFSAIGVSEGFLDYKDFVRFLTCCLQSLTMFIHVRRFLLACHVWLVISPYFPNRAS